VLSEQSVSQASSGSHKLGLARISLAQARLNYTRELARIYIYILKIVIITYKLNKYIYILK
jgi:hypothetical protein